MPKLNLDVIVLLAEVLACSGSRGTLTSLAICSHHTWDAVCPALYRFLYLKRGAHARALHHALSGARAVRYGRCIKRMSVEPRAVRYFVRHWNGQMFSGVYIVLDDLIAVLDGKRARRFFAAIFPTTVRRLKIISCERFPSVPLIMATRSNVCATVEELVLVGMRGPAERSEVRVTLAHVQAFSSLRSVTILYELLHDAGAAGQFMWDFSSTVLSFIQLRTLARFRLLFHGLEDCQVPWTGNAPAPLGTVMYDVWLLRGARTWRFINALLEIMQNDPRYTVGFIDAKRVRLITDGRAVGRSIAELTSYHIVFFGTNPWL